MILLIVNICHDRHSQGTQPQEIQQRKILYMGLYLLIWGEAANIRFMPECLCYIFHNVTLLLHTFYIYHQASQSCNI
jgi:1,3-beta-glucan synthase subunit FKS1, domain-1